MSDAILLPTHARFQDLTGKVFFRLTVVGYAGKNKNGKFLWKCLCECGTTRIVIGEFLRSGDTKSCGCWRREVSATRNFKHGESRFRLREIWINMRQRCRNSRCKSYRNYGGRGITVCDVWVKSYENFRDWAVDNGYDDSLQIDRIDNNGNYEPGNCRWVTKSANARNRRSNRLLTLNGKTRCVTEWAEILNINAGTIRSRLNVGWSVEQALTTGVR